MRTVEDSPRAMPRQPPSWRPSRAGKCTQTKSWECSELNDGLQASSLAQRKGCAPNALGAQGIFSLPEAYMLRLALQKLS